MSGLRDPGARPPRKTCRRYSDRGHAHALTFSCLRRQAFLSRDRTRIWMIEAIESARRIHGFDLWAYAIMPEHVHLLIHPRGEYQIDRILTSIKRPVARKAVAWLRKRAPTRLRLLEEGPPAGSGKLRFWQRGGGYDRNLWSPDYVWQTIDYIHANPIRRGLCDAAHQWRWSSAADYLGIENGLRSLDTESLPDDSRRRS